ncbi:hypothetical protein [Idiomarina aquatica]|uniref:hypothetical protein n=1 Tax=Idiomarina aquatica TaxID=1327752 RepID=UPI00105D6412|nr:hypothetical protein [Idiomarina aquatica]
MSVFSLLAITLAAASVTLLYYCWRQSRSHPLLTLLGWILLAASVPLWAISHGIIFAVCFALLALSPLAWLLVVLNRQNKPLKAAPGRPRLPLNFGAAAKALPKHLVLALATIPLAGLTAMQSTTLVTGLLPWARVDLMALGIYIMPVVWAGFSFWVLADSRWWRPILVMVAIVALCSWGIYR